MISLALTPGIGRVEIHRFEKMRLRPIGEGVYVCGDGRGWRINNMPEDRIEHRSREFREIGHEVIKLAVEIAKK